MDEGNDLERLIKLLKKTMGSNDHETVMAIRMTNAFLEKKGWDWERLLHGKIKVIADPFSMVKPIPKPEPAPARRAPPPPPATTTRMKPQPSPAPTAYQSGAWPQSSNASRPSPFSPSTPPPRISPLRANKYPGNCWQCGYFVDRNAGHIFHAGNLSTTSWEILCVPCEVSTQGGTRQLSSVPAIRKNGPSPAATPSVDQL